MELGSWWLRLVYKGCLVLPGTWSHLRYIRGSELAHFFLWLVILACVSRLITLWYLSHFFFFLEADLNGLRSSVITHASNYHHCINSTHTYLLFSSKVTKMHEVKIQVYPNWHTRSNCLTYIICDYIWSALRDIRVRLHYFHPLLICIKFDW
jgi:hypothetical protein